MPRLILIIVGMFVLTSCASGFSEAEVRELIEAEIASIPQGPPGPQGERGPQGRIGLTREAECHTHNFEIGTGNHSHSVFGGSVNSFGLSSGYTSESNAFPQFFGPRKTGVNEPC